MKLLLVGTIILLCGLLVWEINKRRTLEDSHAREVAALMKVLATKNLSTVYAAPVHPSDRVQPIKISIPKMKGNRIEGNVFIAAPPPREEE